MSGNIKMEMMSMEALKERITTDTNILSGKPVIRGLRISVEQVLRAMAAGVSEEDLLADYPELEREDILAALMYAADIISETRVYPVAV